MSKILYVCDVGFIQAVVARYKLALQLRPGWEKGYFCLGQYVDFLFKSRCDIRGARRVCRLPNDRVTDRGDYIHGGSEVLTYVLFTCG